MKSTLFYPTMALTRNFFCETVPLTDFMCLKKRVNTSFMIIYYIIEAKMKHFYKNEFYVLIKQKQPLVFFYYNLKLNKSKLNDNKIQNTF